MSEIEKQFLNHKPALEATLGETVSITGLTGPLRIFQRLNGHRHSLDDTATAWYALQKCPHAASTLDLGTGIGTVGQIVLWGLGSDATLTCVEAQDISFKLLVANVYCNGLSERVTTLHGDLRDLNLNQKFPLITGSPPYFPKHAGVLPQDGQKAHARFELRGDVGDYARAAKRHLTPDGVFVYCFPAQQKQRGLDLVRDAGLKIVTVRDVLPLPSKPPLFSLYSAKLEWPGDLQIEPPFLVADEAGNLTPEMTALQASRGF